MTRRKFNADIAAAAAAATAHLLDGISNVKKGDDDGQLDLTFSHNAVQQPLNIRLVVMDMDAYPGHPGFLAFTSNEPVPSCVSEVLGKFPDLTENKSVTDALRMLIHQLSIALEYDEAGDASMTDYEDGYGSQDDDEAYGGSISEYEDLEFDDDDAIFGTENQHQDHAMHASQSFDLSERLVSDLLVAQGAGCAIGIFGRIVSLSIPARSLGLSAESLAAWDVDQSEYLMLLIQIDGQYTPTELFVERPSTSNLPAAVQFHFGKCAQYKPSRSSAQKAFAIGDQRRPSLEDTDGCTVDIEDAALFRKHLISDSIDKWMLKDLASLLKLRLSYCLTWDESIEQLAILSRNCHVAEALKVAAPAARSAGDDALVSEEGPAALNIDWVASNTNQAADASTQSSLPIIAMQFALRYFAKCTRYCMVCHQKFTDAFTAMRPYVCEAPLCLYQYMALGFGQSLEHEITTQPLVVDLLISFCYAALASGRMREFPKGMRIMVPSHECLELNPSLPTQTGAGSQVTVNLSTRTLWTDGALPILRPNGIFSLRLVSSSDKKAKSGAPSGSAPAGSRALADCVLHCKVTAVIRSGTKTDITFAHLSTTTPSRLPSVPEVPGHTDSKDDLNLQASTDLSGILYPYNLDLNDVPVHKQSEMLLSLLETLPSVDDMRGHLLQPGVADLTECPGLLNSALCFLKWIVASNRSLILQIDCPFSDSSLRNHQDLKEADLAISGMGERWIQFKFAQGSPEKERRFHDAVEKETISSASPTLFAWHGSHIGNWHSIIRDGLDFRAVANGRAFGNGVYFSRDYHTSSGYSNFFTAHFWPQSTLKIASGISLCEIVNKKEAFVSSSPHYVVDKLDWIQCRYLLVTANNGLPLTKSSPQRAKRGPDYLHPAAADVVRGPNNNMIDIPKSATRYAPGADKPGAKFSSGESKGQSDATAANTTTSHLEDDLDRMLRERQESSGVSDCAGGDKEDAMMEFVIEPSKTDFEPGHLDVESLPRLPPPTWATDDGRKLLGRELRRLQKVQATTPLHELGWYMDFGKTDNLFHWIVELHSFDAGLPVAADMKKHKARSIVLEIRFGREFPISPPFIRIIRPRFLPFAEGGGGHVTAGGAMCLELLTNSGWSPANSMESVILQVRMAICNLDPVPARLARFHANTDYGIDEAIEAYKRVAARHGWRIPPDLDRTASGV